MRTMFWRRISFFLLCLVTFSIAIEHKYDKLFRFFSLKLIPTDVILPNAFEKKIYFYPSDIIAFILFLIALFALRIPIRRFFVSKGAIFLWLVFFLTIVSILFSPLSHYPIIYIRLLHLATPFILFCFLANASTIAEKPTLSASIIGCVVITALIQSVIAIAQYGIQGPLGLRILNEPSNFASFFVPSGHIWLFDIISNVEPLRTVIRASGTFPHANVLGGFLSASILVAYSFFFTPRLRFLSVILIPIQFFAMSLTFSRSALFGWGLGTIFWFSLHLKQHGFRQTYQDARIRLLFYTIICSTLFSMTILYEQISNRGGIVNYNGLAQDSDAFRIAYQNTAFKIILDNPLYGAGFQQLTIASRNYVSDDPRYSPDVGAHNIYLYLAAETGLLSLAAFFLFFFTVFWRAVKSSSTPLLSSLIAIFLTFAFIGGCDFYLLLFQQGKLLLFIWAGLLVLNTPMKQAPYVNENLIEKNVS